tara:strand:- start:7670 stop:8293 length:624 start_codon:yes stop_codon:yes gene_type:complete
MQSKGFIDAERKNENETPYEGQEADEAHMEAIRKRRADSKGGNAYPKDTTEEWQDRIALLLDHTIYVKADDRCKCQGIFGEALTGERIALKADVDTDLDYIPCDACCDAIVAETNRKADLADALATLRAEFAPFFNKRAGAWIEWRNADRIAPLAEVTPDFPYERITRKQLKDDGYLNAKVIEAKRVEAIAESLAWVDRNFNVWGGE